MCEVKTNTTCLYNVNRVFLFPALADSPADSRDSNSTERTALPQNAATTPAVAFILLLQSLALHRFF